MTKKQFLWFIVIWFVTMLLIFETPVSGAEIGLVKPPQMEFCTRAEKDEIATILRLGRLQEELSKTEQENLILVLNTEIIALENLGVKIHWWINENCRNS